MTKVQFNYADRQLRFTGKTAVKSYIETIFKKEKKKLEAISYIFCSDDYLLQINKDFLQHDYYTDIITFDISEPEGGITSEVYISIDRVKDNAIQHGTSFQNEILRVLFHGALHLCGYKDKKSKEITLMREKEDYYINDYLKKHK
ncbi:rRNA maturation RNase YbeY [Filimonas effusa]|uniref:Endoribonuclease YbeY n=1 Tax=Filimonas effusa TaxID=2508721 RepID=A0A4Q1D012_9BACT|nr:rRNA maturation RNase YbeY [Filimonas effusa]RXK81017.1 rRNA maturation RNase YbeY [Filimonas effusa]